MILRPEVNEYVTVVPPLARRWVFEGNPNERKADPVSIDFVTAVRKEVENKPEWRIPALDTFSASVPAGAPPAAPAAPGAK